MVAHPYIFFFFQAEDGIRDLQGDWSSDVCSSDLVKSQSVVLITGAFTGMVLAAQTYYQFHKLKLDSATLAVVSISMCSELGPVLTGLMEIGRASCRERV